MSRCSDNRSAAARACGAAIALATLLSACSDIYYDRRETIAFGLLLTVVTGLVGGLIPSIKAMRLSALAALR